MRENSDNTFFQHWLETYGALLARLADSGQSGQPELDRDASETADRADTDSESRA
jgi:hypothetical protein